MAPRWGYGALVVVGLVFRQGEQSDQRYQPGVAARRGQAIARRPCDPAQRRSLSLVLGSGSDRLATAMIAGASVRERQHHVTKPIMAMREMIG